MMSPYMRSPRHIRSVLISFVGALMAILRVSAWSDEGHMLIATIAKLQLEPAFLQQLEDTLSLWDGDFPGTGSLQAAAVWLDHLSCRDPSPYCSTFKALDDVQLFKTWHYSTRVLNPQNIELDEIYKFYPLPKTGAEWALTTVYESLKDVVPRASLLKSAESVDISKTGIEKRGSPFSLNLHLRLLLHIFGDIHQPMHVGSLFARGFPEGDEGGNLIPLRHEAHVENLHQMWDSAGGLFRRPFRELHWDELKKTAVAIMQNFPPSDLERRLSGDLRGTNFKAIADEGRKIQLEVAYKEFDWSTFSKASLPYTPSPSYVSAVGVECTRQIALAGYRLTYVLNSLRHIFPYASPHATYLDRIQERVSPREQPPHGGHLKRREMESREAERQPEQQEHQQSLAAHAQQAGEKQRQTGQQIERPQKEHYSLQQQQAPQKQQQRELENLTPPSGVSSLEPENTRKSSNTSEDANSGRSASVYPDSQRIRRPVGVKQQPAAVVESALVAVVAADEEAPANSGESIAASSAQEGLAGSYDWQKVEVLRLHPESASQIALRSEAAQEAAERESPLGAYEL